MHISNVQAITSPNFRQVNIVRIPKKAFGNSAIVSECTTLVDKTIAKLVKEVDLTKIQKQLALTGIHQPIKIITINNTPAINHNIGILEKNEGKTFDWLEKIVGKSVSKPESEDFYTYYILTKTHLIEYLRTFGSENVSRMMRKVIEFYTPAIRNKEVNVRDPKFEIQSLVKLSECMDEDFNNLINKGVKKEFFVENLEQLKDIVKKFDV